MRMETKRSGAGSPRTSDRMAARGVVTTGSSGQPKDVPMTFLHKLGEMYSAEKQLTRALPLVEKAAKSKDLKTLLKIHLKETKGHAKALEDVAKSLGKKLPSKSCKRMSQLIGQGVKVIAKRVVKGDKDRELIEVGRKIEQFEINNYTPLVAEAAKNEWTHETTSLTSILTQEKLAYELLGELGRGNGPLNKLVKKVSLEHARAPSPLAEAA